MGVRHRVTSSLRKYLSKAAQYYRMPPFVVAAARAERQRQEAEFLARAKALGHGDLSQFYWYHTIDLGKGLITPGDYDYRPVLSALPVPGGHDGDDSPGRGLGDRLLCVRV